MEIRRIRADEWQELRALRLRALLDAPDAFGATYEQESSDLEQAWRDWAISASAGEHHYIAVVDDGDAWGGMAMGSRRPEDPEPAHVYAMWVEPGRRGAGLGTALVGSVLAWAREAGAHAIELRVTETNVAGIRLYGRCGFAPTGERSPLREGSDVTTATMSREVWS
jgi:GNAT superfamily N-acetyltransferase